MGSDLAPSENQHTVLRPESILILVQNTVQTDSTLPIVKADWELFGFFFTAAFPSSTSSKSKKKQCVTFPYALFYLSSTKPSAGPAGRWGHCSCSRVWGQRAEGWRTCGVCRGQQVLARAAILLWGSERAPKWLRCCLLLKAIQKAQVLVLDHDSLGKWSKFLLPSLPELNMGKIKSKRCTDISYRHIEMAPDLSVHIKWGSLTFF